MYCKNSFSICVTATLTLISWTQAELFTAVTDLEALLDTHKKVIDDLDNYIERDEKRLAALKSQINRYKKEHDMAIEDVPNYLGNPINAYTLIKRLTTDLDVIEKTIKAGSEYVKIPNSTDVKYPTAEDLTGAVEALTRLQNTYLLDIGELAEGRLNGAVYSATKGPIISTPMTAGDCFELGRTLYSSKDYNNSLGWMMEALRKYKEEDEVHSFTEVDVLEYISYMHYMLDDCQKALEWLVHVLRLNPDHERAVSYAPLYLKKLASNNNTEETVVAEKTESAYDQETKYYEALCRGDIVLPNEINKKLKCSYLNKNPFLKLAPIKSEQLYIEPDVFVYHQVMSDEEIEHVINLAKPRFLRALVRGVGGTSIVSNYRISKSAWLTDEESAVVARISQRVNDFTGLSMDSAELLQVVNYGIGGHYDRHYDFSMYETETPIADNIGNRVATVLFYMSDVAQGGATVFPKLGISVQPTKGSALVWMNLHPSGEGDLATYHAACPVLRGSKWVSNKWLHLRGQEFLRPCTLEYQREEINGNIIKGIPRAQGEQ